MRSFGFLVAAWAILAALSRPATAQAPTSVPVDASVGERPRPVDPAEAARDERPTGDTPQAGPNGDTLPPGYLAALQRGDDALARGDLEAALAAYRSAHALLPTARTLHGLGRVAFKSERYAESARQLEAALASEVQPLTAPMREEAGHLLEVARGLGLVTRLRLVVTPADAQVRLDGAAVQRDPDGRIPVVVGRHALLVEAPGHLPARREVSVRSGPETRLDIRLLPSAPRETETPAIYERWWFWTAAGALVVGATIAGIALSSGDHYEPSKPMPDAVQVQALVPWGP